MTRLWTRSCWLALAIVHQHQSVVSWRNGGAFDSKSKGWRFEPFRDHFFRRPAERHRTHLQAHPRRDNLVVSLPELTAASCIQPHTVSTSHVISCVIGCIKLCAPATLDRAAMTILDCADMLCAPQILPLQILCHWLKQNLPTCGHPLPEHRHKLQASGSKSSGQSTPLNHPCTHFVCKLAGEEASVALLT